MPCMLNCTPPRHACSCCIAFTTLSLHCEVLGGVSYMSRVLGESPRHAEAVITVMTLLVPVLACTVGAVRLQDDYPV